MASGFGFRVYGFRVHSAAHFRSHELLTASLEAAATQCF